MNIYHSSINGVGEFWELSPDSEAETLTYTIHVPEGAVALAVGVGEMRDNAFVVPNDVGVQLRYRGPDREAKPAIDQSLEEETESAIVTDAGVMAYVSTRPAAGTWEIELKHEGLSVFSVNVAVFKGPIGAIRSFAEKHKCKACKVAVRSVLYVALAKVTAGIGVVVGLEEFIHYLAGAGEAALAFLAKTLGVGLEDLRAILEEARDILEFETPLEWLARKVCTQLRLCPRVEVSA
jgi:hypothetical protein